MGINICDKVKVVDRGNNYSTYPEFIKHYAPQYCNLYKDNGNYFDNNELNCVYTVVAKGEHLKDYQDLLLIKNNDRVFIIKEEGVEKIMEFAKSYLKTGYVVQRRNGSYAMVIKDSFDGSQFIDFGDEFRKLELNGYYDNLVYENDHEWDIMKVFKCDSLTRSFRYLQNKQYDKLELIWQRESEQKTKLKESIAKTQEQLKSLQDELLRMEVNS